jgi:hypothetical protein
MEHDKTRDRRSEVDSSRKGAKMLRPEVRDRRSEVSVSRKDAKTLSIEPGGRRSEIGGQRNTRGQRSEVSVL